MNSTYHKLTLVSHTFFVATRTKHEYLVRLDARI